MKLVYNLLLVISLFILIPFFVNANTNKVGNGGNVVRCKDPKSIQLLDFYERDITPDSGDLKEAKAIAKQKLERLKFVAQKLAEQYLRRLNQIEAEIDFKSDIEILEVPDSKHLFKPLSKNCEILQIAVRNNKAIDSDKRFIIRKDLWNELAPAQQAGLLTHEIIHEHFTKLGEESSVKARRLNVALYSEKLDKNAFWKLIKELEIPIYP